MGESLILAMVQTLFISVPTRSPVLESYFCGTDDDVQLGAKKNVSEPSNAVFGSELNGRYLSPREMSRGEDHREARTGPPGFLVCH